MSETEEKVSPPVPKRRRGRLNLWTVLLALTVYLAFFFGALAITGRSLVLPTAASSALETRLNSAIAPHGSVSLSEARVIVGRDGVPRLVLRDVDVLDREGVLLAALNEVTFRLSPLDLMAGQVRLVSAGIAGAQMTVRRDRDGRFSITLPAGEQARTYGNLSDFYTALENTFDIPVLSETTEIVASELNIALEDARSGRIWQATNATLDLRRLGSGLTGGFRTDIFNGTDRLAWLEADFITGADASFGVIVENAAATDIALQAPSLSFLELLDAPVSGSFRTRLDSSGALGQVSAALSIGEGTFRPGGEVAPLEFDRGGLYLTYDPATNLIQIDEISVETPLLRAKGFGQTYMSGFENGWPREWIGQLSLAEGRLADIGVFNGPITLDDARADVRLRLDPFTLDIGQLVLRRDETTAQVNGSVSTSDAGWKLALDARAQHAQYDDVLDFWPLGALPKLRAWLDKNINGGAIPRATAAVRYTTGNRPVIELNFDYEQAELRFLKDFPPVRNGRGRASLSGSTFVIGVDEGSVNEAGQTPVNVAGSQFMVADARQRPAQAELDIRAEGPLQSILATLDNAPLNVLKRAELPETALKGLASAQSRLTLPIKQGLTARDVEFSVTGNVRNVRIDGFTEDRTLRSDALSVEIADRTLRVAGAAEMGRLPVDVVFRQSLTPDGAGNGSIEGTARLNDAALAELGLDGVLSNVSGETTAEVIIGRDSETSERTFLVRSDLGGLAFGLPAAGWNKSAGSTGELSIEGRILSDGGAEIESLSVSLPGLAALGSLSVGGDGNIGTVSFQNLRLGNWLRAPVTISGLSPGRTTRLEVLGGDIDLRGMNDRNGGSGQGAEIGIAANRLIVSDGIILSPFTGQFRTGEGLRGSFEGLVPGGARIEGEVLPQSQGTAIRLRSSDAGGVLQGAGMVSGARGGEMEVVVVPREGEGRYRGKLTAHRVLLEEAPAMARILDAVSIVGLLDELNGAGILFEEVDAVFSVEPNGIRLERASAVGPSMGVSVNGVIRTEEGTLDLEGVLSPLYLVNGIGSVITRTGEGLFGVTFTMKGPISRPQLEVNPLSLLTPGFLREIFRRQTPATLTESQ